MYQNIKKSFGPYQVLKFNNYNLRWTLTLDIIYLTKTKPQCWGLYVKTPHDSKACRTTFSGSLWPWNELSGMFTPGKIGSCVGCFPLLNNLSLCRMMDSEWFGNGPFYPSLMDGQQHSLAVLHCVDSHLNAPEQQTDLTSAFIEVLTLMMII